MTSADLLPAAVLRRKAVVYVRQSTQAQVQANLESQRRQYELVDVARRRGFREVEVIDDDLGRSASGTVARPGFERLVAWLCAGEVGAVLCFDASRLARNGRDWHHLLELCGLGEEARLPRRRDDCPASSIVPAHWSGRRTIGFATAQQGPDDTRELIRHGSDDVEPSPTKRAVDPCPGLTVAGRGHQD